MISESHTTLHINEIAEANELVTDTGEFYVYNRVIREREKERRKKQKNE